MSDEILIPDKPKTTRIESTDDIAIGQWYWTTTQDYKGKSERWLGCVTRIGSNYAELSVIPSHDGESSCRVHFDNFADTCEFEPDAERIIREQVETYRQEASRLMQEVQDITRRLAITPRQSLNDGSETQALAIRSNTQSIPDYKKALIKAKEKELPKLFEEIKAANQLMGNWMKAPLLAMKAEAKALEPAIKAIESRIFNVELYAGLVEEVKRIKDGLPADIGEPVHIFQRRAYCDEECLANYETGGMEFKDLKAFDKWLVKPDNLERLLPHKRCVLAFQVRRKDKERETPVSLSGFIQMMHEQEWDKTTFLYIRNDQQVFRLNTEIEFGSRLFPDTEVNVLSGTVYARMFAGRIDKLVSEGYYLDIIQRHKDAVAEYKRKEKELRHKKVPKEKWFGEIGFDPSGFHDTYEKWTPDTVYYDDIAAKVQAEIDHHNRLILVLQGLFDRSPVFHPHPPYKLWSGDSFQQAIKLIYDDSRGLVAGDKPDFEAYRARLNETLRKGSITVGQDDFWQRKEAERYNRECHANWRIRHHTDVKRHKPYGNPGPGMLAMVKSFSTKGASYKWQRERQSYSRYSNDKPINCNLTVPASELLNVDAYQVGDFKQFFNDPRTRADYLQWATLLLTCEEWHAGNKKVNGKTVSQLPKKRFIVPKKVRIDLSGKIFFARRSYNPHKRGSKGHASYQILMDNPGIDLKEFKVKGGHRGWLVIDIGKDRIRVEEGDKE